MGEHRERPSNISITSPAIARLVKEYSWYVKMCIQDTLPIEPIDRFYNKMVRAKEMNKSRLYERYRKDLQLKETDNDNP